MMKGLWKELKPLYQKFHGYIRYRLREIYGHNNVSRSGPIPTHLLDMWGFDWSYLTYLVKPYPKKPDIQLTTTMYKKGMSVLDMVRMSEDFYVSMGLEKMVPSFWKKSLFSHKAGEKVDCTISAWDFSPGDYRIKMPCASLNEHELLTVIHEMGHIEYDMMYSKQPYVFRNGANPAFHEAVGDAVSLSARVPSYLKKVGLLPEDTPFDKDPKIAINALMTQALKNIAILPFAITIDFWRWKAFSGEITPERYNDEWWNLKLEYQGVTPPAKRTKYDFDPGANSHICNNTPYARYFIGAVLQFQFHQALCKAANHVGPLHKCSIYGSKEAGAKLRAMLEMGRSKPWQDALEVLTGQRFIDASAIKSYFQPLENWLDKQQAKIKYPVGW
ncbi:angiotensin-converting enzyme-like [Actinia tenebrosa]|uniref:Angiotensin-converting enzyme n=1 Tax=Actinia tenebrosa TaxID=6105 RepID=A0A6P8H483_ACTTE|nr:angiotensin-converting enzyme-like [Actinia tenebrosa]